MSPTELASGTLDVLKVIAPWLTGGLAGAVLTLLVKRREAKRERRVLAIDTHLTRYALPKLESQEAFRQEDLRIAYRGKQYTHLSLLECSGRNSGPTGIEGQKILFVLPEGITVVEKAVSFAPAHVEYTEEVRETQGGKEYELTISRLEPGDRALISLLLDGPNVDAVQCLPRGVDNVAYTVGQLEAQTDLEADIYKILLLLAFMLLGSAMPFLGGMLQSMVFILMIPYLRRIIAYFLRSHRNRKPPITVGEVHTHGEGTVNIEIKG